VSICVLFFFYIPTLFHFYVVKQRAGPVLPPCFAFFRFGFAFYFFARQHRTKFKSRFLYKNPLAKECQARNFCPSLFPLYKELIPLSHSDFECGLLKSRLKLLIFPMLLGKTAC